MKLKYIYCFVIPLVIFTACKKISVENEKIIVATTLAPYADVIEQIGKDKILVHLLIEPGQNAHSFELMPSKLTAVEKAKIYLRVGKFFDIENSILAKVKDFNSSIKIFDCSEGILIKNRNPHIWLSPKLMRRISENITDALILIDKKNKDFYKSNFERFTKNLQNEDSLMNIMIKAKSKNTFAVYHAAWEYFADDYGLKEISIEEEGKSPQMKSMKEKIQQLSQLKIKTIFADPQFDSLPAETIAKSIGAKVDFLNPLPTNYLRNLSEIRLKLSKSLN
ncbi:MAG: metal ABC transporter substrate-binding protein [Ignavibacteriales bacterium]